MSMFLNSGRWNPSANVRSVIVESCNLGFPGSPGLATAQSGSTFTWTLWSTSTVLETLSLLYIDLLLWNRDRPLSITSGFPQPFSALSFQQMFPVFPTFCHALLHFQHYRIRISAVRFFSECTLIEICGQKPTLASGASEFNGFIRQC